MKIHEYPNGTFGSTLPVEQLKKHEARAIEIVDIYFDGIPAKVVESYASIARFKDLWQSHFGVPFPNNIIFNK